MEYVCDEWMCLTIFIGMEMDEMDTLFSIFHS